MVRGTLCGRERLSGLHRKNGELYPGGYFPRLLAPVRLVGPTATCEGLHGSVDAVAESDGEHCSKLRSDEIRDGTSCAVKLDMAMGSVLHLLSTLHLKSKKGSSQAVVHCARRTRPF